jgi:hypothetical protein
MDYEDPADHLRRALDYADRFAETAETAEHVDQPLAADEAEQADHVQHLADRAEPADHVEQAADHRDDEEPLEPAAELEHADQLTARVTPTAALDAPPRRQPGEDEVTSASYVRLGAEGLVRLRGRYAEVMARIAEHPVDEDAREELKERAERLNPDAWVTADEVTAALEQYETVFEGLRGVVGRHPQRRRRGRKQV